MVLLHELEERFGTVISRTVTVDEIEGDETVNEELAVRAATPYFEDGEILQVHDADKGMIVTSADTAVLLGDDGLIAMESWDSDSDSDSDEVDEVGELVEDFDLDATEVCDVEASDYDAGDVQECVTKALINVMDNPVVRATVLHAVAEALRDEEGVAVAYSDEAAIEGLKAAVELRMADIGEDAIDGMDLFRSCDTAFESGDIIKSIKAVQALGDTCDFGIDIIAEMQSMYANLPMPKRPVDVGPGTRKMKKKKKKQDMDYDGSPDGEIDEGEGIQVYVTAQTIAYLSTNDKSKYRELERAAMKTYGSGRLDSTSRGSTKVLKVSFGVDPVKSAEVSVNKWLSREGISVSESEIDGGALGEALSGSVRLVVADTNVAFITSNDNGVVAQLAGRALQKFGSTFMEHNKKNGMLKITLGAHSDVSRVTKWLEDQGVSVLESDDDQDGGSLDEIRRMSSSKIRQRALSAKKNARDPKKKRANKLRRIKFRRNAGAQAKAARSRKRYRPRPGSEADGTAYMTFEGLSDESIEFIVDLAEQLGAEYIQDTDSVHVAADYADAIDAYLESTGDEDIEDYLGEADELHEMAGVVAIRTILQRGIQKKAFQGASLSLAARKLVKWLKAVDAGETSALSDKAIFKTNVKYAIDFASKAQEVGAVSTRDAQSAIRAFEQWARTNEDIESTTVTFPEHKTSEVTKLLTQFGVDVETGVTIDEGLVTIEVSQEVADKMQPLVEDAEVVFAGV